LKNRDASKRVSLQQISPLPNIAVTYPIRKVREQQKKGANEN
jgi:hypothetical protein